MDNRTEKNSRKFNILLGILTGVGLLSIIVLTIILVSLTFFYDKDTLDYFADEKIAIMSINGEFHLGETITDADIPILLRNVEGYKRGDDRSYVRNKTEFAIINERDDTWIIKNLSQANEEERKALEELVAIE